jgi:hypothetical protein
MIFGISKLNIFLFSFCKWMVHIDELNGDVGLADSYSRRMKRRARDLATWTTRGS